MGGGGLRRWRLFLTPTNAHEHNPPHTISQFNNVNRPHPVGHTQYHAAGAAATAVLGVPIQRLLILEEFATLF